MVSDRAYVLEKGQFRFSGTIDELEKNETVRRVIWVCDLQTRGSPERSELGTMPACCERFIDAAWCMKRYPPDYSYDYRYSAIHLITEKRMTTRAGWITRLTLSTVLSLAALSANAQQTIKIGEMIQLQGAACFSAGPYKNGWILALEQVNAGSGVLANRSKSCRATTTAIPATRSAWPRTDRA